MGGVQAETTIYSRWFGGSCPSIVVFTTSLNLTRLLFRVVLIKNY